MVNMVLTSTPAVRNSYVRIANCGCAGVDLLVMLTAHGKIIYRNGREPRGRPAGPLGDGGRRKDE